MGSVGRARFGALVMIRLSDGDRVRLSTGHEVTLPLVTEATVAGAVRPARDDVAESLLPDGLTPVRVTARQAAVVLVCVEITVSATTRWPPTTSSRC